MSSIAAPILLTVVFAFFVLGLASAQQSQMRLALAAAEGTRLAGERMRTAIEIRAITAADSSLSLEAANIGGVSIVDFQRADLIVDYTGIVEPGNDQNPPVTERVIVRLSFTTLAPAAGEWRVAAIVPDALHPGLWNPGESVTIEAALPRAGMGGTSGVLVLGTPNGVTATSYFTFAG